MSAFAFADGHLYVYEGAVPSTTPIAYVQDVYANILQQYSNPRSVNGVYRKHLEEERVDVSFTVPQASELALIRYMASRANEVHLHIESLPQYAGYGHAQGLYLYSGVFDLTNLQGAEGALMLNSMRYFCNNWSAYV